MLSSGEILHASLGGCRAVELDLRSREGGQTGNFDVQSSMVDGGARHHRIHILRRRSLMFYLKANVITAMQTVKTVLWF